MGGMFFLVQSRIVVFRSSYVLILRPSFVNLCVRLDLKPLRTPLDFWRLFSKSTSESVSSESSLKVFLLTMEGEMSESHRFHQVSDLHEGISSSCECSSAYFCGRLSRVGLELVVFVGLTFLLRQVYVKPQQIPLISRKTMKMKMMT
jgi:hypothetical protein